MATAPMRRMLTGTTLAGALALTGCASTGTTAAGSGTAGASGSATATGSASATAPPSGTGDGGPDTAALKSAADATSAAGSAKLTLDETVQAAGKTVTVHGSGTTQLGGAGNGQFTLTTGGQSIQIRVLDKIVYELLPPAARSAVPGKKPWVRIDLAKAAAGGTGTVAVPNASQGLAYLDGAKGVTRVGAETVDGAGTTHYRFQAALPQGGTGMAGVSLPSSIPVDVWVDGQQHIREEKFQLTLSASATASASASSGTQTAVTTTDLRLSGFGTPVKVTAPPAAQTADLTGAASSALASPHA